MKIWFSFTLFYFIIFAEYILCASISKFDVNKEKLVDSEASNRRIAGENVVDKLGSNNNYRNENELRSNSSSLPNKRNDNNGSHNLGDGNGNSHAIHRDNIIKFRNKNSSQFFAQKMVIMIVQSSNKHD